MSQLHTDLERNSIYPLAGLSHFLYIHHINNSELHKIQKEKKRASKRQKRKKKEKKNNLHQKNKKKKRKKIQKNNGTTVITAFHKKNDANTTAYLKNFCKTS